MVQMLTGYIIPYIAPKRPGRLSQAISNSQDERLCNRLAVVMAKPNWAAMTAKGWILSELVNLVIVSI